jgi:hypothetical protein
VFREGRKHAFAGTGSEHGMTRLILIGYWRSDQDPSWPDPAELVDTNWDPNERALVASYLEAGTVVVTYMGYSPCRLCAKRDNGSVELTDGVYVWPNGLAHYVAEHSVRLPGQIVDHILGRETEFERGITNYDTDWWKHATRKSV